MVETIAAVDVIRAFSIAGPFMEKVALATTLMKVPGAVKIPGIVAAATRMGGALDDCFDRTNRRTAQVAIRNGERKIRAITTPNLWMDYVDSWRQLISEVNRYDLNPGNRGRIIANSVTFFRNIRTLEHGALLHDAEDWNLQEVVDYRKVVCLMWAEYFASLSPRTALTLDLVVSSNPQQVLKDHEWGLRAEKSVRELYFGSVAYQMVGDWAYRRFHQATFVPGLGSLGCEVITKNQAQRVINEQISLAQDNQVMGFLEAIGCRYILPLIFQFVRPQTPSY